MHAYATGPDLDALIARLHGDPAFNLTMAVALRTAGCPSAERKALTTPTGGALPVTAPVATPLGVDSSATQLRHQGRADALRRRRKERDDFLGREGQLSQSPSRKGWRQTLYSCLVQPQVDASIANELPAAVSRASSNHEQKNWIIQSRSGVRPLDFRDHIAVRRTEAAGPRVARSR